MVKAETATGRGKTIPSEPFRPRIGQQLPKFLSGWIAFSGGAYRSGSDPDLRILLRQLQIHDCASAASSSSSWKVGDVSSRTILPPAP